MAASKTMPIGARRRSTSTTRSFTPLALASVVAAAVLLAAVSLLGCGGSPTYNWAAERAAGYKVGAGDLLRISVWKHDELSQPQVTVRPDGVFSLPLVGDIPSEGRTADEIAVEISKRLERYYADKPPVTVQVAEVRSYKIYVVGEVNRGGEFTPNHQVSVLHSIALAGGFTRFANPARIIIMRKDARGERRIPFDFDAVIEKGDLQQNLALQTGDTVIVP